MTTTRFFICGSFCEGMVHFAKVQSFIQSVVPARIRATAYRLKVGFPVLIEGGDSLISGQLVELRSSDILVGLLDEFFGVNMLDPEKGLYQRKEILVESEGAAQSAWTYFLNARKLPSDAKVLVDGDWKKSLDEAPALTEKLTERQRSYILRLGATSGREIVPIDLKLYRELMGLELIVDKGRRLALSKFGHEVYRFLT